MCGIIFIIVANMLRHVKNYLQSTGKLPHELMCEHCGNMGKEIHHIQHRQKNNPELDNADNLICLCVECHKWIHQNNSWENKQKLLEVARNR